MSRIRQALLLALEDTFNAPTPQFWFFLGVFWFFCSICLKK